MSETHLSADTNEPAANPQETAAEVNQSNEEQEIEPGPSGPESPEDPSALDPAQNEDEDVSSEKTLPSNPEKSLPPVPEPTQPNGEEVTEKDAADEAPREPPTIATNADGDISVTPVVAEPVPEQATDADLQDPNASTLSANISTGTANGTRPSSVSVSTTSAAHLENSSIFKKPFETILETKEAKKNDAIKSAVQKALDSINDASSRDPFLVFNGLKTICENGSNDLKSKAIDLFAKLFDYGKFDNVQDKVKLTDDSVDVIAACFEGEGTDPEVELQVTRALMHSVLLMPCHGASLLKAVRSIYNVFIFSLNARNQAVAQGILTQVIGAIFQRVIDAGLTEKGKSESVLQFKTPVNNPSNDDVAEPPTPVQERLTLENLERLNDDQVDSKRVNEANQASDSDEDLVVKDAFLIFRAMCKLSVKEIETDTLDMRSHSVRSKLLSLNIIHTILKRYIDIFLSRDVILLSASSNEETRLINAVRQYLCLSLSRNAASPIAPVFELSLEIFWLIISNLRSEFKREIPVFFDEIYFPVSEMKTSTPHQKRYFLSIIERLCNDSRCVIEFYLNYDCDSEMPSICEIIIDYLTKLSLARVEVTAQQKAAFKENKRNGVSVFDITKISNLISSQMQSRPPEPDVYNHFPLEYALKMTSINCSVAFLRSLYTWAQKGIGAPAANGNSNGFNSRTNNGSLSNLSSSRNRSSTANSDAAGNGDSRNGSFVNGVDISTEADDPTQFESLKQRKKALLEGIKQFNQKASKGIKYFIENGFIESNEPQDVAKFLLETDGLDKAVIGEYLGEGKDECIATMHAFVDLMDFTGCSFVDAMRTFLQSFRLPGEAQKIDRFMLKFAERYVMGNPNELANAESAYVLSYSVILLNTDLHSPQIKKRMSLESFIQNNAGIDDNKDLPREYLELIYNEIANNEIKLHSEQHAALLAGDLQLPQTQSVGIFSGRDLNKEAYFYASKEMSTKTEKLVRDLGKRMRDDSQGGVFYQATHVYHVKSIFDTLWMSILAGLTPPFKEYNEEDVTKICLEGIKLSIKISCMFDLDYAKKSFIGALIQFENLSNYEEMSQKNVDAIYIMLEIAITDGDYLKNCWLQILTSISQLERLQLIARGVDQDSIPDVSNAKLVNRNSLDQSNHRTSGGFFRSFTHTTSASQTAFNKFHNQKLTSEVADLLLSSDLGASIDKVFSNTSNLNGASIVEFIKALSAVSLEEIESSGQSANPRLFSLQKIVDICYYNMTRIRVEWSQLWSTMGETFNVVGCHSNINVVVFAIDSLRQLSMRFFELEELAHFKFQKQFLSPFEYIINNNESLEIKDMVLECLNNMILAKSDKIKSGWKAIFNVLVVTAKESKESLVQRSYKLGDWICKKYLSEVKAQDAFPDLIKCFTELCKNGRFQKINLLSLDVLYRINNQIAMEYLDKQHDENNDVLDKLWFPVLFGFHDVIMTGEELEVRSRALTKLFDILLEYGENFDSEFWDSVCKELLFPIFGVLHNKWGLSNLDDTNDNLSVWLSTTLIQALRNMTGLFSHYHESLKPRLQDYLNLFTSCICQENDTISRIGISCLQTLMVENCQRFDEAEWELCVVTFRSLFDLTEAKELFDLDPLKVDQGSKSGSPEPTVFDADESTGSVGLTEPSMVQTHDDSATRLKRTQDKSSIVVKCVLQLLMIETLNGLLDNDTFYESISYMHLVQLAQLLNTSFSFSKNFNDDYDLRVRLWNAGVIERLPNLLKQESSSAAVYINIMFRMYCDDDKTTDANKKEIIDQIIPLCTDIIQRYSMFDETNQQRNISTWKPVIIEIYQGFFELEDADFKANLQSMYSSTVKLFSRSLSPELRSAMKSFYIRVGEMCIDKQ